MKSLYLLLNVFSFFVPFLYSFNPKMRFIKHIKSLLISTSIVALLFLIWDGIFTHYGVWGFNDQYTLGFKIFKMPFEEFIFFLCIPYASIFIHYSLAYFLPEVKFSEIMTTIISYLIMGISIFCILSYSDKLYTLVDFSVLLFTLIIGVFFNKDLLRRFYVAFIIILIPFTVVNGILTGTGIEDQVVWYNNTENMNIRFLSIPLEDIAYAFSMLFLNILIFEKIKKR